MSSAKAHHLGDWLERLVISVRHLISPTVLAQFRVKKYASDKRVPDGTRPSIRQNFNAQRRDCS
jgi:hypothetical protein